MIFFWLCVGNINRFILMGSIISESSQKSLCGEKKNYLYNPNRIRYDMHDMKLNAIELNYHSNGSIQNEHIYMYTNKKTFRFIGFP